MTAAPFEFFLLGYTLNSGYFTRQALPGMHPALAFHLGQQCQALLSPKCSFFSELPVYLSRIRESVAEIILSLIAEEEYPKTWKSA
jgi:hypothetical protein